jgi:hypothetical protein
LNIAEEKERGGERKMDKGKGRRKQRDGGATRRSIHDEIERKGGFKKKRAQPPKNEKQPT